MVTSDRPARATGLAARPASAQLVIAGLLLMAVAAGLAVTALSVVPASDQIRWSAITLAVFCAGLLPLMSAAAGLTGLGLSSWRIGPWCLVWGSLAFGLATISWLSPQTITGPSGSLMPGSMLRALWMLAVAMATLSAGYCAGPYRLAAGWACRAAQRFTGRLTDQVRGPLVPWVLAAVGLACQLGYAILTGHYGYVGNAAAAVTTASGYSQYLVVAGECLPLALVIAAFRAYQTRTPGARLTLLAVFVAAIAAGAVAGGKESFVVATLAVIIPHTIVRGRLPAGAITVAVLAFLLVVIPFNQAYRSSARGTVTLSTSQAVAAAPAIASQVLSADISAAVLGESASYLAQRLRTIDTPAMIMQRTPSQIPYASPVQLLVAPLADVIPRILWPGKPVLTPGYQVSQEYFMLPADVYTSSDVTPEADLYRHGGWIPLIIGMFLLGCGIRILDEVADLRRGVHGTLLIILLFPAIVEAGSDCATLLAGLPGMVVLWLIVVNLSFARRRALFVRRGGVRRVLLNLLPRGMAADSLSLGTTFSTIYRLEPISCPFIPGMSVPK